MLTLPTQRGLDGDRLTFMLNQWAQKRSRNTLRSVYADGKNALRDLGISLPPQMRNIEAVLGWPMKGISALSSRCSFDGWVIPGEEQDPFGLADLAADNNLATVLPQAIASALIHSVSFLTITPGRVEMGEPEVLILPRSARSATGIWDARTGSMSDSLSVARTDNDGFPTEIVWYGRDHVTTYQRGALGSWVADSQPNPLGRIWVEPLVYKPELERPFGRSRISRAVMYYTDAGLRTLVRSESHAEFFASPQRWALGVDEEAFGSKGDRWNAVMSRFLTVSRDEEGNVPEMGQFSQMPMQPHSDHLRTWAALFSGETSVSMTSLGVVQDSNPSSAEAIYAAKEDLVIEASSAMAVWGDALRRVATTAVMMRDGLTEVPDGLRGLRTKWRNPATPSIVSASDALTKQAAVLPWIADSEVALELLGYDDATITRLLADKRRSQGGANLQALVAAGRSASPAVTEVAEVG